MGDKINMRFKGNTWMLLHDMFDIGLGIFEGVPASAYDGRLVGKTGCHDGMMFLMLL
jgi:hypothetical protein